MTPYEQLVIHIQENGGVLKGDPIIDGRWHNIPADDGKPGNKSFGYVAYQNPDGSIGGKITNYYRSDENEPFIFTDKEKPKTRPPRNIIAQQNEARERQQLELERSYALAARRAEYVYSQLSHAPADHPYLARKQIDPYMAKINQSGQLVIPMINAEGKIQSLEFISDNGFKKIMPKSKASGAFTPLGFLRDKSPPQIIIAEGFATAASLHDATGIPTVHARGKGNIATVTDIMRTRHPDAQIIIAADNDQSKKNNWGLATAQAIQANQPVIIMLPEIDGDYNDLAVMPDGRERIQRQFADIDRNQYLTESKAFELFNDGKLDRLLHAAQSGNIDLTPALTRKMLGSNNKNFANAMMRISLNDQSPQVREAAASVLSAANEGGIGPDYSDVNITDTVTIGHDASPISSFAAAQTDLDKQGIDLPDQISTLIASWRQEIENRQAELGLSDDQVAKITGLLEERIIAHQDKALKMPPSHQKASLKENQKQRDKNHER